MRELGLGERGNKITLSAILIFMAKLKTKLLKYMLYSFVYPTPPIFIAPFFIICVPELLARMIDRSAIVTSYNYLVNDGDGCVAKDYL